MKSVIDANTPKAGDEWKPVIGREEIASSAERELGEEEGAFRKLLGDLKNRVSSSVKDAVRDIERAEHIIEDPLAYYVPYHSPPRIRGIYFRVDRMLSDFEKFARAALSYLKVRELYEEWAPPWPYPWDIDLLYYLCRRYWVWAPWAPGLRERCMRFIHYVEDLYRYVRDMKPLGYVPLLLWDLWRIYVTNIYWHELAHHAIEDVATVKRAKYPALARNAEEGFCEYTAFNTSERAFYVPCSIRIPLIPPELHALYCLYELLWLPFSSPQSRHYREYIRLVLSILYYHWDRDKDPVYRPVVDPSVPKFVGARWNAFWEAHVGGYNALTVGGDEIYKHLYITRQ